MDQVQKDTGMEEGSEHTDNNMSQSQSQSATSQDQMQKCRQWLMSIPRQDVADLQHTQEYRDFIRAFERLSSVHRSGAFRNQKRLSLMALEEGETGAMAEVAGHNNSTSENEYYSSPTIEIQRDKHFSFLQHMADDDIIIRMFEFLDSQTLVRVSMTCSRFHELALESAAQRTHEIAETRQLNNVFHLLRAQEQIDGIGTGLQDRHVRVPVLLLGRRVTVTGAGDPEYNGLYFCTGSNGNGFIFTKPRFPERRIIRVQGQLRTRENIADAVQRDRLEREVALPGKQLRCIISKRFSNETILWYMSKEVLSTETAEGDTRAGAVTQTFSYWSKLMVVGEASPDLCRYPSQTSVLARHNQRWNTLTPTLFTRTPTVELLD